MRYFPAIFWALLSSGTCLAQSAPTHTITSNLEYRLTRGDLPNLSFGIEKPKNVEVIQGGEELLQNCLSNTATWTKDPLLFRLAHTHAASIQSCRENNSPSIHAVFRKVPDEPLQVWVHLDGHGSQTSGTRMVHLGEVLYHKATFQNNDQDRMYEDLQRSFSSSSQTLADPVIPLTGRERLLYFTNETLTRVQPYASSAFSSAALQVFSTSTVWGRGTDGFTNRLAGSFTRRLTTYGFQSAAAAALHEELRYRPSLSGNVWKRTQHALFSTFVLQTPRGNDIAYANIVASVGSAAVIGAFHPGQEGPTHAGMWSLAGMNLLGLAEGNLWSEFKPDIKVLVRRKILHHH
jgi:hypothetical protein